MKKYFVEFLSPGTFCSESTTLEIDSHNVATAVEMSKNIVERHGAKPYGFRFITRERKDEELDSKITYKSGTYFLGGEFFNLEQIKERNDPADETLIWNMEINNIPFVIINNNSYKTTMPFDPKKDKLLLNH